MVKRDRHYTLITVLSKTPSLRRLVDKASNLNTLNEVLHGYLSPLAAKHCQVANWEKGVLTISTTSPAWKHHIRFYHMDLGKRLKQTTIFRHLTAIQIIVTPDVRHTIEKNNCFPPPVPLSEDSVAYIQTMLAYVDCPRLKAALLKLAEGATQRQRSQQTQHSAQYTHHAPAHAPYYSPYAKQTTHARTATAMPLFQQKADTQLGHPQER
ncbi:MAG: hypothetical protein RLZ35_1171 [Pseudomonadota bacterium]|jgi:hypothetical protein